VSGADQQTCCQVSLGMGCEMIRDLVVANRSYRRFQQSHAVDMATLRELIELATLCPSSGNLQPLRYVLSCDPEKNTKIFQHLAWAGYLADWPGPTQGERDHLSRITNPARSQGRWG
jgi:nitroreductase